MPTNGAKTPYSLSLKISPIVLFIDDGDVIKKFGRFICEPEFCMFLRDFGAFAISIFFCSKSKTFIGLTVLAQRDRLFREKKLLVAVVFTFFHFGLYVCSRGVRSESIAYLIFWSFSSKTAIVAYGGS